MWRTNRLAAVVNRPRRRRARTRRGRRHAGPLGAAPSHPPARSDAVTVWEWSVDAATEVFLSCGPASRVMLGYGPNELIGRHAGVVLDPAEIRRAHAVTEAFGAAGTSWPGLSVSARHRNGTSLWLQTTVRPRQDADGTIRRIDGIARMVGPDTDGIRARQRITARIEAALADRSVRTAFQPIVALAANAVIGVEALSRFGGGPTIGDDRWFADAASVGLGTELELLAVQRALTTAQLLPEHLYVSVNASPATCLDPALTELITCGPIDPARVVLELTEHDAVTDYDALAAALKTLRGRAVRLAVDDAGSGFASFQHILRLRPDVIKLDRCIVSGVDTSPAGRALSAAVVSFAERIGAGVLGEGIQTQAELSAVTELGMHAGRASSWAARRCDRPTGPGGGRAARQPGRCCPPSPAHNVATPWPRRQPPSLRFPPSQLFPSSPRHRRSAARQRRAHRSARSPARQAVSAPSTAQTPPPGPRSRCCRTRPSSSTGQARSSRSTGPGGCSRWTTPVNPPRPARGSATSTCAPAPPPPAVRTRPRCWPGCGPC